ncbi:MAG TPA: GNAT family N-acetyltransferase [Pseudomonadales bacterium]|nr:GNAT family N-acetyltransferase [Pseudomonadales bacterium]
MDPKDPIGIRTAGVAERDAALATILLAFATDPVARFAAPSPADYLATMNAFAGVMGDAALARGAVFVAPDFAGVAYWHAPGAEPDEETLGAGIAASVPADRQEELMGLFEAMASHHPDAPHWYLPQIGVDPSAQGRGVGAALMKHALAHIDAEGLPAYLESSNPRNISLYERFGFEAIGEIRVGRVPLVTPMLRPAR